MRAYKVTKYISKKEHHWLKFPLKVGQILYEYTDCTYGCISFMGVAVTKVPNETPFFEVPASHIKTITKKRGGCNP